MIDMEGGAALLDRSSNGGAASVLQKDRVMMSRSNHSHVKITRELEAGAKTSGCCECCSAPSMCPGFALCLFCFGEPDYIVKEREASKYVYIRENSIEWNEPKIVTASGYCCGQSLGQYRTKDDIKVLYFDDPGFDRVQNHTRCCNEYHTWLCGGRGETAMIDSTFCYGMCLRAPAPFLCVPCCCPHFICPCSLHYKIFLENAERGCYEIKAARDNALARMQV
jgi:hypothetical protein